MGKTTLVVGGGIVGLACAIEMQRRGGKVTLVDHADPGSGCSFGNAGIIAVSEIFPMITPARLAALPQMLFAREAPAIVRPAALPRLLPWMTRAALSLSRSRQEAITSALVALNRRAVDAWRALLADCDASTLLREMGMIRLIRDLQDRANLCNVRKQLAQHALPSRLLDKVELRQLEPALGDDVAGGLLHESDADIGDPYTLCQALLRRFRGSGGFVVKGKAMALRPCENGAELRIESDLYRAGRIVVAAGLASGDLLRPLGASVPLHAERGYHLALPAMGRLLNRPVTFQRESCVATPMGATLRLAGTVEFADATATPDWQRAHRLGIYARRYFRETLSVSGANIWMGCRPSLPDSLPAIGRFDTMPSIGYAFGHQHLGVTQAAVSARLLCDLMNDEHPSFDPAPYSLLRF